MANNNLMDKLLSFFGIRQDSLRNDFRNPIWSSDDEDDGDELYTKQHSEEYNRAMDLHEEFTNQMHDIFRSFGTMFGDFKTLMHDSPFDSFVDMIPLPSEHAEPEHFNGKNIRDYYLKPGYHTNNQENVKEDIDLDGKITSNEISGLFKKKKDTQIAAPMIPFNGDLVPGQSFCQTIITTSVTKRDGTVETRRIVKSGNEVVEESITSTSTSTGPDNQMPSGLNQLSSSRSIYNHITSELSSVFRHFY